MANDIGDLISRLKNATKKESSASKADLTVVLEAVEDIKRLVSMMALQSQLDRLTDVIGKLTDVNTVDLKSEEKQNPADLKQAIENIAQFTAHKNNPDKPSERLFVLHRLTEDLEFENSIKDSQYKTEKNTEWTAEFGVADLKQDRSEATLKGANPIVSCLIPESSIVSIAGAEGNNGTWGDLGRNPKVNKYKIVVKPGTYQVYQEQRQ